MANFTLLVADLNQEMDGIPAGPLHNAAGKSDHCNSHFKPRVRFCPPALITGIVSTVLVVHIVGGSKSVERQDGQSDWNTAIMFLSTQSGVSAFMFELLHYVLPVTLTMDFSYLKGVTK
jgi:hypothetical protein